MNTKNIQNLIFGTSHIYLIFLFCVGLTHAQRVDVVDHLGNKAQIGTLVTEADNDPTSPKEGDIWIDTSKTPNTTNIYDFDTETWKEVKPSCQSVLQDSDTNTKIQLEEATDDDTIRFDTSGEERMVITDEGNVGIGTSSPSQELHVTSSGEADIRLQGSGSANRLDIFHNASDFGLWGTGTQVFKLATNGSERLRIDSSGNVGIGDSSPHSFGTNQSGLTISDGVGGCIRLKNDTGTANFDIENGGGAGTNLNSVNAFPLKFSTNNAEAMRIDSSGNVGIGTSSPTTKLQVKSSSYPYVRVTNDGYMGLDIGQADSSSDDLSGAGLIKLRDNAPLAFYTSDLERMRIDADGAVSVNTTESDFKLNVNGTASAHFGDSYDPMNYGAVQITRPRNQPDNKFHLSMIRNGQHVVGMGFLRNSSTFAIQNNEDNTAPGVSLEPSQTSWGTTSDERKKNIIGNLEDATAKLADWRTVYFRYKTDEEDYPQRLGLIAQDIQKTVPEAVSIIEDEENTLHVRYTELVPVLVKAIQEQQALIESLTERIIQLENN